MKLFLDDVRQPPDESWAVARTYSECVSKLRTGQVTDLSLDHDLGTERTGYHVACWIEAAVILERFDPPTITVHSANPVGRRNIEACVGAIQRSMVKRESIMNNIKTQKVARLKTEVIETILSSLTEVEESEPTPDRPLAGSVFLSGIGQVKVSELRAELARRN